MYKKMQKSHTKGVTTCRKHFKMAKSMTHQNFALSQNLMIIKFRSSDPDKKQTNYLLYGHFGKHAWHFCGSFQASPGVNFEEDMSAFLCKNISKGKYTFDQFVC